MQQDNFDVAIIGGGLAGLSLAIQLASSCRVLLFEKESYPFHKVCGEYISMESHGFLERLGIPLTEMALPNITSLVVTAPDGNELRQQLDLGGFGISRFTLDDLLQKRARSLGVTIFDQTRVEQVAFANEQFSISTTKQTYTAKVCCGSFGKRSNLDLKWKRPFALSPKGRLQNYVGVKYHVRASLARDTISLHNFPDGYCGISAIEEDKYCLCYLTRASNLKRAGQSIEVMEKTILSGNPALRRVFDSVEKIYDHPETISQISFEQKSLVEQHVIMLGDAAGMITPLCGNGMSMAMHASLLLAGEIRHFLEGKISRAGLESNYTMKWKRQFHRRLQAGRLIQRFFGKAAVTNGFIRTMKIFPSLTRLLIRSTHGKPF